MTSRIYPVQKSGNLFIVKASIGRMNAAPSILQLLIDTGATQTGLPIDFLNDILGMDFLTQLNAVIDIGKGHITFP